MAFMLMCLACALTPPRPRPGSSGSGAGFRPARPRARAPPKAPSKDEGYVRSQLLPLHAQTYRAAGVLPWRCCENGSIEVLLGGGIGEDGSNQRKWNFLGGRRKSVDTDVLFTATREAYEESANKLSIDHISKSACSGSVLWLPEARYAIFLAKVCYPGRRLTAQEEEEEPCEVCSLDAFMRLATYDVAPVPVGPTDPNGTKAERTVSGLLAQRGGSREVGLLMTECYAELPESFRKDVQRLGGAQSWLRNAGYTCEMRLGDVIVISLPSVGAASFVSAPDEVDSLMWIPWDLLAAMPCDHWLLRMNRGQPTALEVPGLDPLQLHPFLNAVLRLRSSGRSLRRYFERRRRQP